MSRFPRRAKSLIFAILALFLLSSVAPRSVLSANQDTTGGTQAVSPPNGDAAVVRSRDVVRLSAELSGNARTAGGSRTVSLPNGETAVIDNTGLVKLYSKNPSKVMYRLFQSQEIHQQPDRFAKDLLTQPEAHPYVDGQLIVIFRAGISASRDSIMLSPKTLQTLDAAKPAVRAAIAPAYTNDTRINSLLAAAGVDKQEKLFTRIGSGVLSSLRAAPLPSRGVLSSIRMEGVPFGGGTQPVLDLSNVYRIHVTRLSVEHVMQLLTASGGVSYVSPDWRVKTADVPTVPLSAKVLQAARVRATSLSRSPQALASMTLGSATDAIPTNYALSSSAQSMLNAPADNATAAFDEIQHKFHQLPGQGEIITNVSLGDLAYNPNANCYESTTHFIGGQMYIDWPSMPLIPAYTADANGNLSGSTEECNQDSYLTEVGLDFSVMAPLPHNLQRPAELGAGFSDILGIAPGASYRLVVPLSSSASSSIDAALLAAATQNPRPDVITASLEFGFDGQGFAGRYLEDDPLTQAIIASIVQNYHIVVCIAANDGTRIIVNPSVGPSGGSVPTQTIPAGGVPSVLNDVAYSTVPSRDFDSGALDVGGTTLDDIFSVQPQDPSFAPLHSQHAFPETRWNGFLAFSSGFGSRVDVAAPSDNILAFSENGGNYDSVRVVLEGGTSASSPETAAAAAVALQVARLTGRPFQNAVDVRTFLEDSGTVVPGVPQSDIENRIGTQIDLGRAVETLLARAGTHLTPAVPRVAVEQRRNIEPDGFNDDLDGAFISDTNPTNIDLQGPVSDVDGTNTDANEDAWTTIAPDWEGIPNDATFALRVVGKPTQRLSTTRFARLLPDEILHTAGLPLVSASSRTVNLEYTAYSAGKPIASTKTFALTFGPADATTRAALAPIVPPVATGSTISVRYDLTHVRNVSNPTLVVSEPGRFDPFVNYFHPILKLPLTALRGLVSIPVSELAKSGGGIYGISIIVGTACCDPITGQTAPLYSDFAFTRVDKTAATRPEAPLLSANGGVSGHFLDVPYGQPFNASWNVSNVPGATGAIVEIGPAGPTQFLNYNTFNNPTGCA
ncbi:MAG: S8 family serine peptidase [Candidatus Eremiobacteraeota bacterium]|nr:S8 family serine peptidase [Candidatus Eremiobacteraeota bacterium]MBC5805705.1 S8 family serine peptidase [Candidatus Eremiobacteraeota bacterium]MBC5824666.1 S8 family serine peptidase [Candidatus Eremiobacteraeota bacterium]